MPFSGRFSRFSTGFAGRDGTPCRPDCFPRCRPPLHGRRAAPPKKMPFSPSVNSAPSVVNAFPPNSPIFRHFLPLNAPFFKNHPFFRVFGEFFDFQPIFRHFRPQTPLRSKVRSRRSAPPYAGNCRPFPGPRFSTQWKKCFHSVENTAPFVFSRRPCLHLGEGGRTAKIPS